MWAGWKEFISFYYADTDVTMSTLFQKVRFDYAICRCGPGSVSRSISEMKRLKMMGMSTLINYS